MKPTEYYEERQTTADGFAVDCGWYKLEKGKSVAYTNGEIRNGDHLVVWRRNAQSGTWYRSAYPLYGTGDGFAQKFRELSDGKTKPVSFGNRIDKDSIIIKEEQNT